MTAGSLAERFERFRPRLVGIAYQMLGSVSEAEDAVQDSWLRLDRADAGAIRDLEGWLVTAVSRQCLDVLRERRNRSPASRQLPEPLVTPDGPPDPEAAAMLGEAIGLALLIVLERLAPAERLAFVLHDVFGLPFGEIAAILGKTPAATRQLASRARRRVRGAPLPSGNLESQREVVEAFLVAARGGDIRGLLDVLDPEAVVRADFGPARGSREFRGAQAVATGFLAYAQFTRYGRPAIVNGTPGIVTAWGGRPNAVMAFTVTGGRIAEIDIVADPERLTHVDIGGLDA
ncbi:MAG TPA: sigma-70 family RNA polymerase sigma factor [Candidatus Binatia bacterium]|nr:sigma-70 family RNA polymerase sigma factor [Candidatus Binatia bacterium]